MGETSHTENRTGAPDRFGPAPVFPRQGKSISFYLRVGILGLTTLTILAGGLALMAIWPERARLNELTGNILPTIQLSNDIIRISKTIDSKARGLANMESQFALDGAVYKVRLEIDGLNEIVDRLNPNTVPSALTKSLRLKVKSLEQTLLRLHEQIGNRIEMSKEHARSVENLVQLNSRIDNSFHKFPAILFENENRLTHVMHMRQAINQLLAVLAVKDPRLVFVLNQEFNAQFEKLRLHIKENKPFNGGSETIVREIKKIGMGPDSIFDRRLKRLRLDLSVSSSLGRLAVLNGLINSAESISKTLNETALKNAEEQKRQLDLLTNGLAIIMVLCLLGAIGISIYINQRIVKRLTHLQAAMQSHVQGLPIPVDEKGNDEISDMGHSFVYFVEEVTRREEALAATRDEATKANQAKSDFLANMSHELRTPLNAIIGFTGAMQSQMFGPIKNDKYLEYLQDIHYSGQHLLDLINDILDVSAFEANALELHEEKVDLHQAVEASFRLVQVMAEKGKIELSFSIDPSVSWVFVDKRRLKQIFLNLLSNAVKFTPEGGSVSLNASLIEDGILAIVIADTGIGMNVEEIEKAMSQFGQVDSGLDRKHEGSGLGLPLTKALLEMHGGTLTIESEVGQGTRITTTFPKNRILTKNA